MLPVIIKTNFLTLYTYGVFSVLALFWFLYFAWKYIRITKHREEEIFDRILMAGGIGFFVGRLMYMFFHLDIIVKKGVIAFFAVHLYPGIHGFAVLVFGGLALMLFLARGKKYSGLEIMAYLVPGILVGLSLLSFGSVFAGTDVGVVTTFPIRIKYALYDGLRHTPGLYEGAAYIVGALLSHRLILLLRQEKVSHGTIVALFYWFVSFVYIGTSQIRDIVTYQKSMPYKIFSLYFAILTLLTSLIFVVYYVRSHLKDLFYHLFKPFTRHGQSIHPKTERSTHDRGSKDQETATTAQII